MKVNIRDIFICFIISILLIIVGFFLLPMSIGIDFLNILYWPIEQIVNKETQRELTVLLFGRMTANFAPIQFILFTLFWTTVIFIIIRIITVFKQKLLTS